jgi:hypothetical protein
MKRDKVANIIDKTLRYGAGISVMIITCMAGVFGLIAIASPHGQGRLQAALILAGGAILAVLFFLVAMETDKVAARAPGSTHIWGIVLRVIVYPVGFIGICWLVWQYVTVNL